MKPIIFCLTISVTSLFFSACQPTPAQSAEAEGSIDSSMVSEAEKDIDPPVEIPEKYLLGQFDPAKDPDFVRLQDKHSAGSGRGAYLHRDAYAAFKEMYDAAQKDGISLTIRSATRNFFRQKQIWEAKWNGSRKVSGKNLAREVSDPAERARIILRYSSMPGTSRHHWGTDMDLNAFENDYFRSGKGLKEYEWLKANAYEYGFGQPYTEKGSHRPHGYEEERWHWSYLPLAKVYLTAYDHQISHDQIEGFAGAEVAAELDVILHYVLGVDPSCQ